MATVTTPVEGFTGSVAGVQFIDGRGETEDASALAYFRRHGYSLSAAPQVSPLFDPSEHTVDDVNDYLATAVLDERTRVLAAEAAGKSRQGILSGPHGKD